MFALFSAASIVVPALVAPAACTALSHLGPGLGERGGRPRGDLDQEVVTVHRYRAGDRVQRQALEVGPGRQGWTPPRRGCRIPAGPRPASGPPRWRTACPRPPAPRRPSASASLVYSRHGEAGRVELGRVVVEVALQVGRASSRRPASVLLQHAHRGVELHGLVDKGGAAWWPGPPLPVVPVAAGVLRPGDIGQDGGDLVGQLACGPSARSADVTCRCRSAGECEHQLVADHRVEVVGGKARRHRGVRRCRRRSGRSRRWTAGPVSPPVPTASSALRKHW